MQPAPFIQLIPLSIHNPAFKAAERAIVEESEYRTWASAMMEGGPPLDLLAEPKPRYRFLKRTDSLALLGLEA